MTTIETRIDAAYQRSMERQLARHEEWLAGDWDSRSARGIATMERHRAERDRLRAALRPSPGVQTLRHLPIDAVGPNPDQPRKSFEREPLEELAASIGAMGIVEPLIVQPWPPVDEARIGVDPDWRIVAGERRWRAAKMAGLAEVPCLVREDLGDHEAFEVSMVENVLRRDMNPLEEAEGYQRLLDAGMTVEAISARLGKRASAIRSALTLLKLEPGIRDLVAKGHLTAWDGTRLTTLSWNGQCRALDTIQRNGLVGNDRDRLIGQVWREEHEQPMFSEAEAPAAERGSRSASLREELERAVRALARATEQLAGTTPDPLTIELAEAANRAAGAIVKVTRQARVVGMLA
jgi:ParB family chromosome partitioning protein